jgi:glycosyltransferase involved in cell wall biosynthesis
MVSQTTHPVQWVIVDDGSKDNTWDLADKAAKANAWVSAFRRSDRGCRKPGTGVVQAFYDGYGCIRPDRWDYLVKLDGDLSFEPSYFARCFARFEADPKLGIGGGVICTEKGGVLRAESAGDPPFHVRGATKIYRRACWEAIGGLIKSTGWDTVDELKANMLGWTTSSFPEIKLHQLKDTGTADGAWSDSVKNGRANYVTGYHPAFMLAKCIKRLKEKPYLVGAMGLMAGFLSGYLRNIPRVADERLVRWTRDQQIRRLCFRQSIWR